MENNYKILISTGDFLEKIYREIRTGENDYVMKTINVSGDISENDLILFASRVAMSTYAEMHAKGKTGEILKMKENVANAFILDANGLEKYDYGIPYANFIKGITLSMPFENDKEPSVEIYSADDLKKFDISRSR